MTRTRATKASLRVVQRWSTVGASRWAARVFPELCANSSVLAVVALGSGVRPTDSAYDFDCLYVFRGAQPDVRRPPHDVDLRGFEASKVDSLISTGHDLLVWTIKFGRVVCEHDDYWSRLVSVWLPKLPFPSHEIADRRAERAEQLLTDLRRIGDYDAAVEQEVTALTHRARASLLRRGIFPASRPELPKQLREIGNVSLANALEQSITVRNRLAHMSVGELATPQGQ
jgi:hypothetical protein